ncbi:MAG: DUF3667 domain-containing protein [Flavobacterium sp.]|nr:DUF3667 domain-containing protein [Flavobacterium sp.]
MTTTTCLNCKAEIDKNYCSTCGQKTGIHRITIKHFLFHDLLHGVWHIDKGILFTLKETIIRPGQAALDYVKGKRIRYYNVFYLCLLVIGLNILLSHFYDSILHTKVDPKNDTIQVTNFFKEHLKTILLSIVPILGLNSYWIFRRLKLNIAEQFILSGFCLLGILVTSILYPFFNFINEYYSPYFVTNLEVISTFLIPLFPIWVYFNATKGLYTFWGFLWRIILFYFSALGIMMGLLAIIILNLTDGSGQFYINL